MARTSFPFLQMAERPDYIRTKWNGWGAPDKSFLLSERPAFESFLSRKLGIYYFNPVPVVTLPEVSLPETRMTDAVRRDLAAIVGSENVKDDQEVRVTHSLGKSYEDLVRARRGELSNPPDAVVFPGTAREVRDALAWASQSAAAVIPFGGGTNVVGGVEPLRAPSQQLAVVFDMRRMDKILSVDHKTQTAKIEPGIRGPVLERSLQTQGLTLGHYPESFEYSTLGGWIATRSVGHYSNYYRKIEDLVLGITVETSGGPLEVGGPSRPGTAPELREFIVGSEGCLGVIALAEMRLHRNPKSRRILAFLVPDFETGVETVRELVQQDFPLAMVRLSDEEETEVIHALRRRATGLGEYLRRELGRVVIQRRGLARPCLLLVGLQGAVERVESESRGVSGFIEGRNSYSLGDGPGRDFRHDRFLFPYLRDSLMDIGILLETLETAISWSGVHRLHSNVRKALSKTCEELGTFCIVSCRISAADPWGATLYFTLLAPVVQGEEVRVWQACQLSGLEAIIRSGGTLSYRQGVGNMHRDRIAPEQDPVGVALLRSIKEKLDPAGILNPGKLVP